MATYVSKYPPAHSDTYVKATSTYQTSYPHEATDPANPLTGNFGGVSWLSGYTAPPTLRKFNIDLGEAIVPARLYIENYHSSGSYPTRGVRDISVYGTNSATAFANTTYANTDDLTLIDEFEVAQHVASDTADPQYFVLPNTASYRYIVVRIHRSWGDGYVGFRRIEVQYDTDAGGGALETSLIQHYNLTDPLDTHLEQPYTLAAALSAHLEQPYSFLLQAYLIQHYGDARQLRAWLIQYYRDVPLLRAWLEQPYGDPLQLEAHLEQLWQMSAPLLASLAQHYGIAAGKLETFVEQIYHLQEHPQLAVHLLQPYLVGDLERTSHDFEYEVTLAGVSVSPHIVNWDFRRSRYHGTIEMTFKLQAEAMLAVDGAEVVFTFGGTTYYFRVEGGWRETSSWNQVGYTVTAHSPVKWLGAPWAAPLTGPIDDAMASVMFAALCAPYGITVDYQIVDEYLSGITAEDEAPIDLIRRLLPDEAVLQSGPEGDVLYIQWDDEISVTAWRTTTPAATIDDLTGFLSTSETTDAQQGYTLITVTDQQTAEDNSNLVAEQIAGRTMECRQYLSPWDDEIEFALIHTGGSHVTIEPFGVTTRTETETVEIVDGAGRTRYPIDAVLATSWQAADLGEVTADDDGIIDAQEKRTWDAAHETYTGGDSLLAITYRTRFWRWLVRSPHIEQVQVVSLRVVDEELVP